MKNGEGAVQHYRLEFLQKGAVYYEQWLQVNAEKTKGAMENPEVRY